MINIFSSNLSYWKLKKIFIKCSVFLKSLWISIDFFVKKKLFHTKTVGENGQNHAKFEIRIFSLWKIENHNYFYLFSCENNYLSKYFLFEISYFSTQI